jgi:hypothetical protein
MVASLEFFRADGRRVRAGAGTTSPNDHVEVVSISAQRRPWRDAQAGLQQGLQAKREAQVTDVGTLAEIEAIKRLKARYFRFLDTKQWDKFRSVFTDDLELTTDTSRPDANGKVESQQKFKGADDFVGKLSKRLAETITVHHGHMPEIDLTSPTTAKGIWAMEDVLTENVNGRLVGYGHYHETYEKVRGEWKIKTLHLTRLSVVTSGDWNAKAGDWNPGRKTGT